VDIGPIEKAPIYHFFPGHFRLCITCSSCNLRCKYCQNWRLSQKSLEELNHSSYSPEEIIREAKRQKLNSISFTYTEPTVYYEYLFDICSMARPTGFKTSIVSNGYINREPLIKLLKVLDAVKIDLKGFSERFYEEISSATLKPVLESLITVKEETVWLEIVNLVVPTFNDDPKMIGQMCQWIKENLGVDTPLHFTRFFPNYKLTHLPPTPVSTLKSAYEIAKSNGLRYVYIGNVPGHIYNSTYCPSCNRTLIHRMHFDVLEMNITNGKCSFCGFPIPGKWT
jgi:pyruvate formate lyase activating enzyme